MKVRPFLFFALMLRETQPIISETQRFSPWLLLIFPLVAIATTAIYKSRTIEGQLIASGISLALLYLCNLRTEFREDGFYYRFVPFHLRWHRIDKRDIISISIRKYSPIREYGGWGIRGLFPPKAYNTKGNMVFNWSCVMEGKYSLVRRDPMNGKK